MLFGVLVGDARLIERRRGVVHVALGGGLLVFVLLGQLDAGAAEIIFQLAIVPIDPAIGILFVAQGVGGGLHPQARALLFAGELAARLLQCRLRLLHFGLSVGAVFGGGAALQPCEMGLGLIELRARGGDVGGGDAAGGLLVLPLRLCDVRLGLGDLLW